MPEGAPPDLAIDARFLAGAATVLITWATSDRIQDLRAGAVNDGKQAGRSWHHRDAQSDVALVRAAVSSGGRTDRRPGGRAGDDGHLQGMSRRRPCAVGGPPAAPGRGGRPGADA